MQLRYLIGAFLLATFFGSGTLSAQGLGSITGGVQDTSSASIPGAKITVTNVETGIVRSSVSDAAGRFQVTGLIPDHYDVQVDAQGFRTELRKGLTLNVGTEMSLPLVLQVGQVTEVTTVTADASVVETATSAISSIVAGSTVRDLPLNGRSFDQLIGLESGATPSRAVVGNGSVGYSTEFTVNGSGNVSNVYLMDGVELESAATSSTTPGGVLGKNFGVDAIQEFQILTGSYSAQYGKRMGGIVNIATRSGGNEFHGTGFEFLRNAITDARNFFDKTQSPAPFKRNQFGGTIGGPVKKDRTFFFFNFEALRDRSSPNLTGIVPDANARAGYLPCSTAGTAFTCNASTGLAFVGIAANTAPYMAALFPIPNGPEVGQGLAQNFVAPLSPSNENYYLTRLDHKISDKNSIMARYTLGRADSSTPTALFTTAPRVSRDQNAVLQEVTVFSPTTVNILRFGWNRGYSTENSVPDTAAASDPALKFFPQAPGLGQISFTTGAVSGGVTTSITSPGTSIANYRFYVLNQYDTNDQISKAVGPHSLLFGLQVERIQHNVNDDFYEAGSVAFPSLLSFMEGTAGTFTGINPNQTNCMVGSCNNAIKGFRQIFFSGFAQDDYKVSRNVTLNLGLRYELMTTPVEVNNRIDNFLPTVYPGYPGFGVSATPTLGTFGLKGNHDTFAPRVGLAWDVFGNHKTAVRAGAGIFYDQLETPWLHLTQNNLPYESTLTYSNPSFPNPFLGTSGTAVPTVEFIDPKLKVPTRTQYNVSIQQQITQNSSFTVGYVGAQLHHALRTADSNQAIPEVLPPGTPGCTISVCYYYPPGLTRVQPTLGGVQGFVSTGNGNYQALQVDYTQRVSHGFRYKASFTWAKDIDDISGIDSALDPCGTQVSEVQALNSLDKGLSCFDVKLSFVGNFTYDLPINKLITSHPRLADGWQLGSIVTLQSGTPFTPLISFLQAPNLARNNAQRPNVVVGPVTLPNGQTFNCSNNPVQGGVGAYFVSQCFTLPTAGFYGDLGRDTVIGPGLANGDLTLEKSTAVNERLRVVFRAECFNLGNHPDFGVPAHNIFNTNGTYQATSGLIAAPTLSSSRQMQFSIKLLF